VTVRRPVISVEDLHVWFDLADGGELHAVQGVSFDLQAGERMGQDHALAVDGLYTVELRDLGGRHDVARQLGRVHATLDVRDLRCGERDDLVVLAPAIDEVEVVEVASGRTGNQHPLSRHV